MPFGLDLKSFIAGALFAMFVWPWIMSFLAGRRSGSAAAPATA